MPVPSGLHIGTEDAVVLTWNGSAISNTLDLATAVGTPSGKHVNSMLAAEHLFAGLMSVAECWYHNDSSWTQLFDASDTDITEINGLIFYNNRVFCTAGDDIAGGATQGTQVWSWDAVAGGAAPTAPTATIPAPFIGLNLTTYKNRRLVCGGRESGHAAVYYSDASGAGWKNAKLPSYATGSCSVVEHSDGYLYAVVGYGVPATTMEIWRTNDFSSWTREYTSSAYSCLSTQATKSFGGNLYVGVSESGGATATEYLLYDGTTWTATTAHATARDVKGFSLYTDGVSATPMLWMVADDDLLSYDGSSWTVEDTGATTDYRVTDGILDDPVGSITWRIPPDGANIDTTTDFIVEGTGLTSDIRVYKDTVVDTSNWTFRHDLDRMTGKHIITFSRDTALDTSLNLIDIYVSDPVPNWTVLRNRYFSNPFTPSTLAIKVGDPVQYLTNIYYVSSVRVSGTTRSLLLKGSGAADGTWVASTSVTRAVFGINITGSTLGDPGTPNATPP